MSEKIKFGSSTFDLMPMGINLNTYTKRRQISFTSDLTYDDVEKVLTDAGNIASVQYLSEAGDTLATYADCVSLKVLSKNYEVGIYTAEFSTDDTEQKLAALQAQVDALTAAQTTTSTT